MTKEGGECGAKALAWEGIFGRALKCLSAVVCQTLSKFSGRESKVTKEWSPSFAPSPPAQNPAPGSSDCQNPKPVSRCVLRTPPGCEALAAGESHATAPDIPELTLKWASTLFPSLSPPKLPPNCPAVWPSHVDE